MQLGRQLNHHTPLLTSRAILAGGAEGYQSPHLDRTFADMAEDEGQEERSLLDGVDEETRREIAAELRNEKMLEDAAKDQRFQEAIANLTRDMLEAFDQTREDKVNFSTRYALAERRSETQLDIRLDENGVVDHTHGDGDRRLRLTLGLSASGITTVEDVYIGYLFQGGLHLNDLIGRGISDENVDKEIIGYQLLRHQHRMGSSLRVLKQAIRDAVTFKLGVMEMRWCRKVGLREDPETGFLREQVVHEGEHFENVPLPWVWFSDIDKRSIEEQRVIMRYWRKSLVELERDEVVWDLEERPGPEGVPVLIPKIVAGRYHNLDDIREEVKQYSPTIQSRDQYMSSVHFTPIQKCREIDLGLWDVTMPVGAVTSQGYLELSGFVEHDIIDVDTVERWDWPIENPHQLTKRQLGRILDSIFWEWTVSDSGVVLQMKPADPPRFTYYAESWQPGKGIYGQGVPDRAGELEDMCDQIVNDNLSISERRADPTKVYDMEVLRNENAEPLTRDQINQLATGKGGVMTVRGVDVNQAYMEYAPEANPHWMQEFSTIKTLLDERLMVSDELRGMSEADTLGQARQDLNRSQRRTIKGAEEFGTNILEQIDRHIFEDLERYHDDESFEQYCIKVAGSAGLKAHYIFPKVKGLADAFDIIHAGSPEANREVRQAQLFQMAQFYIPLGFGDPDAYQEAQLQLLQEKAPERFKAAGQKARDARQEIKAFANDHYLAPIPTEDALGHYRMHLQQLIALGDRAALIELDPQLVFAAVAPRTPGGPLQILPVSIPPGLEHFKFDPEVILPQLLQHMKETEPLVRFQMQQQMVAQAQVQQASLPGPGGDSKTGNDNKPVSADVKGANATSVENQAVQPNLGLPQGLATTQ